MTATRKNNEAARGSASPTGRSGAMRRRRRRRRIRIGLIVMVLMACMIFAVLSLTVLFRVEQFTSAGYLSMYTAEEINEAAYMPLDVNLFFSDTEAAEQRIEEKLPYIEEATVRRKLPNRIHMEVRLAKPEYILENNGLHYYISQQGKVLGAAESETDGLRITNVQASSLVPGHPAQFIRGETAEIIRNLLDALKQESMFTQVLEIDLTDLYGIELQYGDLYRIRIGTYANLSKKLAMAQHLIENELDPMQAGTIDVSINENEAIFRPDYDFGGTILPPESGNVQPR
ncbi:MAG: FtsQ-type POTRA domain-containing protein [Clostridia bacterium]|nr:FtsQ-type POTRA domain-containing protein [Clostridia bacterium]